MNETQEEVLAFCYRLSIEVPHISYCATGCRFGQCHPRCMDCSGMGHVAYLHVGVDVPADTQAVSILARAKGWVRSVLAAIPATILIHDSAHPPDPYHSSGERGHWGIFVHFETRNGVAGCITWESASSQHGVGAYWRPLAFWAISIHVPAIVGAQPAPVPVPTPEEDMPIMFLYQGDKDARDQKTCPTFLAENNMVKRWLKSSPEIEAQRGVSYGPAPDQQLLQNKGIVVWPQAYVDNMPLVGDVPPDVPGKYHYAGARA